MEKARIDRGMMYAEACFETLRVIDGELLYWQEHQDRLAIGLAAFGIPMPTGLQDRVLTAAAMCDRDAVVRVTVGGGMATWGLISPESYEPSIQVMAQPYRPPTTVLHLRAIEWPLPLLPRPAKFTADYANTLRGLHLCRDQLQAGESALICKHGQCISTVTANVILQHEGRWWTPATDRALPGVTRQKLLDDGRIQAADISRAWLDECTAMAVTNSVCFVRPVQMINGRELPQSDKGIEHFDSYLDPASDRTCRAQALDSSDTSKNTHHQ